MKLILTALVATILATGLTTQAHAGHNAHPDQPHHDQPTINNKPVVPTNNLVTNKLVTNKLVTTSNNDTNKLSTTGNNSKPLDVHSRRDRLQPPDCRDFRCCCWLPRCHNYLFWCTVDAYWYYWYAPGNCYLPYDQIQSCPPQANVVPTIPGGLPPVVACDDDGPSLDSPPTLPTDDDDVDTP